MAEVIFSHEGINLTIQCNGNDKMKDIINKYSKKISKSNDNLIYLYNGNKINYEKTFNEQANDIDKNRCQMNVIVDEYDDDKNSKNEIISKDIICKKCKENALIDIENFKINIYGCKNGHKQNNILLNEFEKTQKIDINKIICNICNKNNKSITHNNEFYICNTCNKNICPLCKSIHNKKHIIINYDIKNYICKKHNDSFIKYCKDCNENICINCEIEHNNHNIFDYKQILIDENELSKTMKNLKNIIDKFKYKINIIRELFERIINTFDIYYKINDEIISNYIINQRNYHKLQNIHNLKIKNEKIIEYINNIINNNQIFEIYKFPNDEYFGTDDEIYIGEMKNNNIKDGYGIIYYNKDNNRKKYEGEFKDGKIEGKGVILFKDGESYEDEFKDDNKEGKGKYYYCDGNRYEGEFKSDKKEGKGIFYYNNGERYEGEFKEDKKERNGKFYYNNGDIYDGDWMNNKKEGSGTYYYKDKGYKYEGNWKKDKKEGKGTC